jgi:hypothetical protein
VEALGSLALEEFDDRCEVDPFGSVKSGAHNAEAYWRRLGMDFVGRQLMGSAVETKQTGWRPDPSGRYEWRYWDGGWTNRVANSAPAPDPPADSAPAAAAQAVDTPAAQTRAVSRMPNAPSTALPATESELAVLEAVAEGRPEVKARAARRVALRRAGGVRRRALRTGPLATLHRWAASLADEPESYRSPNAGADLPPLPRHDSILTSSPANYGRAGLVAMAACGLGVGAYLPWLSGIIDTVPFERTGFELGKAWGFTWLAAALAIAAILGVRMRPLRWVNMTLAVVAAALTARELVRVHDVVTTMNAATVVRADVGIGLWVMVVSAAGALVASFRIGASSEMV